MPAIIHQTDKRSGITYAYESVSYWGKQKKQSRAKRTLIGRGDPQSGKIVSTDGRGKCRNDKKDNPPKKGPVSATEVSRSFYGATYLLHAIEDRLGVTDDLKRCFLDNYRQILSLDVIECFEAPGHKLRVGEILNKQLKIYEALSINPPTSLCVAGNLG